MPTITKRQQRVTKARMNRARIALAKLTLAEQRALFAEFKDICTCTEIARLAGGNPLTAAGMVVGGFLGAVVSALKTDDKKELKP